MKVPCPVDVDHITTNMSSRERIWCHDCRRYHPWPLKDRQAPLVAGNRAGRRRSTTG